MGGWVALVLHPERLLPHASQLRCSPPGITVRSASARRGRRKSARPAPTSRSRGDDVGSQQPVDGRLESHRTAASGGGTCLGGRSASYGRRTTLRDAPGQTPGFGHMVLPNIWLPLGLEHPDVREKAYSDGLWGRG